MYILEIFALTMIVYYENEPSIIGNRESGFNELPLFEVFVTVL